MRYCPRCIVPETRPQIWFDDQGRCNCATKECKREIDWPQRGRLFRELAQAVRERKAAWDCVIPVSGGKDSHWQVITCLEHGLKPLAVTWKAPARTEVGEANLENLIRLGVDHIDFRVNPEVEKKFMLAALERLGSPAVPMHMALFSIPTMVAVRFGIPLIVWGENSAFEYGGDDELRRGFDLTKDWLRTYGGTFGTTAADWVSDELPERDLAAYVFPSEAELERSGTRAVFLGCYFQWDPRRTYELAASHGFRPAQAPKTGHYDFADIDDEFISIHHYLKWYKFGFTRLFDTLSLEIRNGRMTREQTITELRRAGDQTPWEDIERFCAYVGITMDRFFEIIERFRNGRIWKKQDGQWVIPDFLVPDWEWSCQRTCAAQT